MIKVTVSKESKGRVENIIISVFCDVSVGQYI